MYKIIGGDGNEYGPVSDAQLRQWMAEGRAGRQTQVQREGESDWKSLGEFPEFAGELARQEQAQKAGRAVPPPFSIGQSADPAAGREGALRAVSGPATGLKVTGIICLICSVVSVVVNALIFGGVNLHLQPLPNAELQKLLDEVGTVFGIVQSIIGVVVSIVIWMGAVRIQALQQYQFAFAACLLAMLPCVSPCCLLGLPFGIWALVVLNRPEVKSQFN